jgi:hypothetical protein
VTDQLNRFYMALDRSQLCILPARHGKMAFGLGKAFSVLAFHETKFVVTYSAATVPTEVWDESPKSTINSCLVQALCYQ